MPFIWQGILPYQRVLHFQCTQTFRILNLYPDTLHLQNPGNSRYLHSRREQIIFLHTKLKIGLCCENQSSAGCLQAWMLRKTVPRHWVTRTKLNKVSCRRKVKDLYTKTWPGGLLSLTWKTKTFPLHYWQIWQVRIRLNIWSNVLVLLCLVLHQDQVAIRILNKH